MWIYNNIDNIYVVLIWDVVTFPKVRNFDAMRFSSEINSFYVGNSNDVVTNLEHNQHELVTLNLESSRTCRSPLTRGGYNWTVLTCPKISIFAVCNVDCRRQRSYFKRNQFNFIFNTVYARIIAKITRKRTILDGKDPVLCLNLCFIAWYLRIAYTCKHRYRKLVDSIPFIC